jgi:hypothetical protein
MLGALSASSLLRSVCDAKDRAPSALPEDFSARFFDVQNAKIEPIWQGSKAAGGHLIWVENGVRCLHSMTQTMVIRQLSLHEVKPWIKVHLCDGTYVGWRSSAFM